MTVTRKQDILISCGIVLMFILSNMVITASAEGGELTPDYRNTEAQKDLAAQLAANVPNVEAPDNNLIVSGG